MLKALGRSGPIMSNKYSIAMLLVACGKSCKTWHMHRPATHHLAQC